MKKKSIMELFPYGKGIKKLLLIMKLSFILWIVAIFSASASVYSQTTRIKLNLKNATLEKVFQEIQEQTDFDFFYKNEHLPPNKIFNKIYDDTKINQILDDVLKGTGLIYRILNKDIIVMRGENLPKEKEVISTEQQISISGKVSDSSGFPLPGVSVVIKGTTQGTTTDTDGNYSLSNVSKNGILIFSFIGMKTQEININNQLTINVVMSQDIIGLDEVIAIGYGVIKRSDLTGSVQRLNAAHFETQQATNMLELLNGTVAGLNSDQGTSAAGGGSLLIRGETSLAADNTPLIVLDGVIYNGSIEDINPGDIESVDILKDASSAAIFGSRSAAGVLIITTKRGNTSKPTINFSAKVGISGFTNHLYPQNPEQYLKSRGDYWTDVNQDKPDHYYTDPNNLPSGLSQDEWKNFDPTPGEDAIEMWFDRLAMSSAELKNYKEGKTVDWYDLVTRNGLRQDYDLSLSGGTQALKYYWSLGYTDNEGLVLGDDYKNIRSRINIDADVTDFLKVGVNVQFADRNESSVMASLENAFHASPYGNVYENDGQTFTKYPHDDLLSVNPLIYYKYRDKYNPTQTLFATLFGEIKLPFGFSYRVSYVNRYTWSKEYIFDPVTTPDGYEDQGSGNRTDYSSYEWMVDNIFKWQKDIADIHKLDVTFLINAEKYQTWKSYQQNSQFELSNALSYHALQSGINPSLTDDDTYSTGSALMARLNYSLKNRYLLTVTWRRDGYSAFGQKHPYAEFPSTALGWRISEEDFFNVGWINHLKLRASWGSNGNRAIGIYDALARLGTTKYLYGTTIASGVYSSTMANSDLRWEQTKALNFGVDFSFSNNILHGSAEYYIMTTTDLLLERSLPSIIGYSSVASNLGRLGNRGFELTLNSTNINKPGIQWNSSFVFSFNRNKIEHLYGEMVNVTDEDGNVIGQKEADDTENEWFIGQALDRIWDYDILGIWQIGEEEQAEIYGKQPGDFKLHDVNNDGVLDTDDKIFQGYKNPRYRLGLRNDLVLFKNFEVSAFVRADLDFYGKNNLHLNSDNNLDYERRNRISRPYWTPDNPINDYARQNSDANSPSFNYWENRSFVRLQDLSLAYNVPKSKLAKYKIQNLKIFLTFRNLLTITGWENYDPESQTTYMPKYSSLGINISL